MLDATAPPFDPVDLEPALRPFGQSRMLPRDAYTSPRVFAFEQERFFAGSWTCVGREGDLEGLIARSFPRPGDADRIRAIFAESLADDALDMQVRREGDRIVFGGYPVAVLAAQRS